MDLNSIEFLNNYFNESLDATESKPIVPINLSQLSNNNLEVLHNLGSLISTPRARIAPDPGHQDVNYGPILAEVEPAFKFSLTPSFEHVHDPDSPIAISSSSSTISVTSPMPPTPSPYRSPPLRGVDSNSNVTISVDETLEAEASLQPEFSNPKSSVNPPLTSLVPSVSGIRHVGNTVLDQHFDRQLSPASPGSCHDTLRSPDQGHLSSGLISQPYQSTPTFASSNNNTKLRPVPIVVNSPLSPINSPGASAASGPNTTVEAVVFKTDLSRFYSSSPRLVSPAVQSGQNVIPLAKERRREKTLQLEGTEEVEEVFVDVPVVSGQGNTMGTVLFENQCGTPSSAERGHDTDVWSPPENSQTPASGRDVDWIPPWARSKAGPKRGRGRPRGSLGRGRGRGRGSPLSVDVGGGVVRRGPGRPRGSRGRVNKVATHGAAELLSRLRRSDGSVCARCVELEQQLRLMDQGAGSWRVECQDCGRCLPSSSAHPGPGHNKDANLSMSSIAHHLNANIVPSFRQVSYRGAHVRVASPTPKQCNPGHVLIQTKKASNSQNDNGDAHMEHVSHLASTKIPAPIDVSLHSPAPDDEDIPPFFEHVPLINQSQSGGDEARVSPANTQPETRQRSLGIRAQSSSEHIPSKSETEDAATKRDEGEQKDLGYNTGEELSASVKSTTTTTRSALVAGTEIVVEGDKIVEIISPDTDQDQDQDPPPEKICWSCRTSSAAGPWHRHKTVQNKFLCNACLTYFRERNAKRSQPGEKE